VTDEGIHAVKDGVKSGFKADEPRLKKPNWLRVNLDNSEKYQTVKKLVHKHKLATVCEEAKCPNLSECWSHGTATIMLMGSVCTRACRFCSVDTGNPKGWLDELEPEKTADSVKIMDLDYVVLTSVDRDDLSDGGAAHYARTIRLIKETTPKTKVEALTPDFSGDTTAVDLLHEAGVDVFAQNVETVERLTHPVRDKKLVRPAIPEADNRQPLRLHQPRPGDLRQPVGQGLLGPLDACHRAVDRVDADHRLQQLDHGSGGCQGHGGSVVGRAALAVAAAATGSPRQWHAIG